MSRHTLHTNSRMHRRALAALVVVLGAVLAAPARADHGGFRGGVHFFFGLPLPPIPVPVFAPPVYYAPRVYYPPPPPGYYTPPPVVYYGPPVYARPAYYYYGRAHYYGGPDRHWRHHRHRRHRHARDGGWRD
jgi:hypothetical protein